MNETIVHLIIEGVLSAIALLQRKRRRYWKKKCDDRYDDTISQRPYKDTYHG